MNILPNLSPIVCGAPGLLQPAVTQRHIEAEVAKCVGGVMTLMCGHGERAMTAASILAAAGRPDLAVAVGGPADWAAATGRNLETG